MSDRRELVLRGPLARTLWTLAWPLVLANELNVLTLGILIFWLDRLLGETGLAVESLFRPVGLMAAWLLGAAGNGASVLVARSVGARDGRAMTIAVRALSLTGLVWLGLVLVAAPLAPAVAGVLAGGLPLEGPLLRFFLPWLLFAFPAFLAAEILLDVVSATGATRFGLVRVLTNLAVIAALVPLMVSVLGLGIAGAPLGEGLGAAALAAVLWLAMRRAGLGLGEVEPGAWRRPDRALWREMLAIGLPMSASRAAGFAAQLVLVQIVAREGAAATAGYGIAAALVLFGAVVTLALGQACAVVIGQSLGAELPERARAALRAGLAGALLVAGGFVAVTLAAGPIIALFTEDRVIAAEAARALAILRWAILGISAWQVLMMTFAALKSTGRASALTVAADGAGLAFAALWPWGSPLETVALAFCVACWLKALALGVLLRAGGTAATRLARPSR